MGAHRKTRRHLTVIHLDQLHAWVPQGTGVYRIAGDGNDWIYVGQTTSLGARLRAHSKSGWWPRARRLCWTFHDSVSEARAEESREIIALRPSENVVGRWMPVTHWWSEDHPEWAAVRGRGG